MIFFYNLFESFEKNDISESLEIVMPNKATVAQW